MPTCCYVKLQHCANAGVTSVSHLQVALIQCAQAMGIQRYIFFSIHNCERHPEVPLMLIKSCTEDYLRQSGLDYTIFRLCGFMQVGRFCRQAVDAFDRPLSDLAMR